jgi:hypothetical protein
VRSPSWAGGAKPTSARPQDIEGCLVEDEFPFVDSRPITTLSDRQKFTDPEQHLRESASENVSLGSVTSAAPTLRTQVAFPNATSALRRLGDVREWRMTLAAGKPVTLIVPSGRPRHAARSFTAVGPAIRTR